MEILRLIAKWLFIICACISVVCVIIAYFATAFKKEEEQPRISVHMTTDEDFSIKGINYAGLSKEDVGDFSGTLVAVDDNEHDPHAVAVYKGTKRVGWLPRGNEKMHEEIKALGGSMKCRGFIDTDVDEDDGRKFFFGYVHPER